MINPSVFYDYQCFMSPYGGNPLYFSELARGGNYKAILPHSFNTCNVYYREITGNWIYPTNLGKYANYAQYFGYGYFNKKMCTEILKKQEFDVFHPTYYDPYFLPFLKEKPFVVMVPDMTHEIFPYMFGNAETITTNKALLMDGAAKIITLTESTKRDIINLGGIDGSKIIVIPLATSLNPSATRSCDLPEDYILFVGNREIYKNFGIFARVVSLLMKNNKNLYLVCAGGGAFSQSEINLFSFLGILQKIRYHQICGDLAEVYKRARIFVFPSLYEGFGVPTIEAMSCGCPVCCSNTSAFLEVGGNAAYYFNPYDAEDMKVSIEYLIKHPDYCSFLKEQGFKQAAKFSWDKTRERTSEVYRGVCL